MTAKAVAGIATFSRLTFGAAGTYALTISDGSLAHATSQSIVIKSK